jgi:hypothetical protein
MASLAPDPLEQRCDPMNLNKPPFNPGRFTDALAETLYAHGWGEALKPKRERERRARLLRKSNNAAALALAVRLDACAPKARCRSGACPECGFAAQKLYAKTLRRFIDKHRGSKTITAVTIVPTVMLPPGTLSLLSHRRALDRLKYALKLAGVQWFVGGVDFSFNEHSQNRYPAAWSWHVHGLAPTKNLVGLKRGLKGRFRSSRAIPRPVKVVEWDGRSEALNYTLKWEFERRVGRDGGIRHTAFGGKRTCRVTEKQRLRSHEKRELLLHLHEIGLQGRLFFRCAQFQSSGAPKIVLRKPKPV